MDTTDQSGAQAAQPATPPVAAQPTPPPTSGLKHAGSIGEALSTLASYIPGFAGYKAVEDRRLADKQLRAVIGERLANVKGRLDALVDSISRSGNLDGVALIDQSGRKCIPRLVEPLLALGLGLVIA